MSSTFEKLEEQNDNGKMSFKLFENTRNFVVPAESMPFLLAQHNESTSEE